MSDRPRVPLSFGSGLDRFTGQTAVEPSTMRDLRNVYLDDARMEIRKGLDRTETFASGDGDHTVIAIHPCRSRSRGVVVTVTEDGDEGSGWLWVCNADGTGAVKKGLITFFSPEAARRVIIADAYDRVFVAHDEPDIQYRWPTGIYNFGTDLVNGEFFYTDEALAGETAIVPAFRGVYTYLNYLVAWGYGTTIDPARPETVWISIPGKPNVIDPSMFFIAGIRGDAVIDCKAAEDVLMIRKGTESYKITGTDRATFGIVPADREFGQGGAKLGVTVGGINYFWSANGPRKSGAGASVDLSLPLDLTGPPPDALAAAINTDSGFAAYDPTKKEILFIFGAWAFVFHLVANPQRWSYRKYGVVLTAAGVFYESSVGEIPVPPDQLIVFDPDTPTGAITQATVEVNGDIAGGTPNVKDRWEIWGKQSVAIPFPAMLTGYARIYSHLISGATDVNGVSQTIYPGCPIDLALRTKRGSAPAVGYESLDPTDWPADAQQTAVAVPINTPVPTGHTWHSGSPDRLDIAFSSTFFTTDVSYMVYQVQVSDGMGGWTPAPIVTDTFGCQLGRLTVVDVEAYAGTTVDVRVRHHTAFADSGWATLSVHFA